MAPCSLCKPNAFKDVWYDIQFAQPAPFNLATGLPNEYVTVSYNMGDVVMKGAGNNNKIPAANVVISDILVTEG